MGAVVGAILYVVLSFLYDRFYGPLGLEPEDVGLTRGAIVWRALAGVIAVAAVAFLVACVIFIGLLLARSVRPGANRDASPLLRRRVVAVCLAFATVAVFVIVTLKSARDVDQHVKSVKAGAGSSSLTFAGLRVLDIEAPRCAARWIGQGPVPELISPRLVCLGSAEGVATFHADGTTIRVPSAQVIITLN